MSNHRHMISDKGRSLVFANELIPQSACHITKVMWLRDWTELVALWLTCLHNHLPTLPQHRQRDIEFVKLLHRCDMDGVVRPCHRTSGWITEQKSWGIDVSRLRVHQMSSNLGCKCQTNCLRAIPPTACGIRRHRTMFFCVTVYSVHITLLIVAVMNLGDIVQLQFFLNLFIYSLLKNVI